MASSEIACWAGVYTWWTCCPWPATTSHGQDGNPACWSPGFSYAECCKAGPPGYERLGANLAALRAELRKVRGDPLDCRGVPFIIWDVYFELLQSFTQALSKDDLKAFLLQTLATGAEEAAPGLKKTSSTWRSKVDQVIHTTEFIINTYRPLLARPLTRAHGMSVPLAGLEDSAESLASARETLGLASFCFYGFFTAVLIRLAYTLPLLPETHSTGSNPYASQSRAQKEDVARRQSWALGEREAWNSTLQAIGTWIPASEYVDFWSESRWGRLLGRGDLLLEALREELGFPLYDADEFLTPHASSSWLPHRAITRRTNSISSSTTTTSIAVANAEELPILQAPPSRERAEIAMAAFEQMRRRLDMLMAAPSSTLGPVPGKAASDASAETQIFAEALMPRHLSTAVWSNHFGDALEIMGLLRSALPSAHGWKWTWHFAGLDHPGGRAGAELKLQVCGKIGACRSVPFMAKLYMTGSAFSDADDVDTVDSGDAKVSLAEAYATEMQSLKDFLHDGDTAYGPGADLLVCSQPFLACALLGEVLPSSVRILVYLHYPPLFNIAHPQPVYAALQRMLSGQVLEQAESSGQDHPKFSVICGAPLDCKQLECLLGSEAARSLLYAPPVAAYVSTSVSKRADAASKASSSGAQSAASRKALVWRLHHFLGGWAWNLVSMWPGLLERHLELQSVAGRDGKTAKALSQVELQFYGVVEQDQLATDTFFMHEELAQFLAIVLLPWDLTLKTFDELYAMGIPLLVPGTRFATGLAMHTMLRSPERFYWYHLRERHWGGALAREAAAKCSASGSEALKGVGAAWEQHPWAQAKHLGGALFFNRQRFTLQSFATAWSFSDFSLRPCVQRFEGVAEMVAGLLVIADEGKAASIRQCMQQHQEEQMALASDAIRDALRRLWPQDTLKEHGMRESEIPANLKAHDVQTSDIAADGSTRTRQRLHSPTPSFYFAKKALDDDLLLLLEDSVEEGLEAYMAYKGYCTHCEVMGPLRNSASTATHQPLWELMTYAYYKEHEPNHTYYEGCRHAHWGRSGEQLETWNPKGYRDLVQPASNTLFAFVEALRQVNAGLLSELERRFVVDAGLSAEAASELVVGLFRDVALQVHWGASFPPGLQVWEAPDATTRETRAREVMHTDHVHSILQITLTLAGKRVLMLNTQRSEQDTNNVKSIRLERGDVYGGILSLIPHGALYPSASFQQRTIAVQLRTLMHHRPLWAKVEEGVISAPISRLEQIVQDVLVGDPLQLPTGAEVQALMHHIHRSDSGIQAVDTPGWVNSYGYTCAHYAFRRWCANGAFAPGNEWMGKAGATDQRCILNGNADCAALFDHPGLNCIVCGKMAVAATSLRAGFSTVSKVPGIVLGNAVWLPLLSRATGAVATDQHERVVEVPLAHYFLQTACAGQAARQCMELGAVTPYWSDFQELEEHYGNWVRSVPVPGHVLDLHDTHAAVTARPDLSRPQPSGFFVGKSVLSISTVEHFGWDDAPDLSTRAAGWRLVQQICREADHFLLTWGLGWNPFLDSLLEESYQNGASICPFIVLRRTGQLRWEVDVKRRLRQLYGCTVWQQVRPGAGAIDHDEQSGFHGGTENFWWRTDRTHPDMLPLFESSAMRHNLVPPGPVVPVCPAFRYFGQRVYDENQLEAHFPGANAVVVITNLPELLQTKEGSAT